MIGVAFGTFVAGFLFGLVAYRIAIWRWRTMYARGEAECWRCHGSGRERS